MNETVTTIVGNVISDVKQRRVGEGLRVASFRIASNERRYDKAVEQWVDGDRLYVTVTCWRKLARNVSASLVKGDPVIVTGRLFTRGFEVEGQKRSVTELEAIAVGPDLSRCLAELDRTRREATEDVPAQGAPEQPVVGECTATAGSENVRRLPVPSQAEPMPSDTPELAAAGAQ